MNWDQQTSQLVEVIYDCVLHQRNWVPLMKSLASDFDSATAYFFVHNPTKNELLDGVLYHPEFEPQHMAQTISLHEERQLFEEKLFSPFRDTPSSANPFVNSSPRTDLHLWNEDRFRLLSTHPVTSDLLIGLALQRSREYEAFQNKHLQRLQMLLLHLARAMQIQRRMNHLEFDAQNIVTALDSLPTAVVIVDEKLHHFCCNQRGRDLLNGTQALSLKQGIFTLSCPTTREELQTAIHITLTEQDPIPPQVVEIRRPEKLPLKALPVLLDSTHAAVQRSSRVMLLIYDPEARLSIDGTLLEYLFELTSSEAFIAARLAEGLSIQEIADLRNCSPSTVRTHVKRLFNKTHTNRQGELVQLILTSPALSIQS